MVGSTIKTALQAGVQRLKSSSPSAILDAELLLLHAYCINKRQMNKIKLITNFNDVVPPEVFDAFMAYIEQRSQGKPVQYITGIQEFMGLELEVCQDVLIPRADTEITVEKLLTLAEKDKPLRIIDMCTGTGAIAISLAHFLPQATVVAVDVSEAALACCSRNIQKHKLQDRVRAVRSNLFQDLTTEVLTNNIDMIVSNPPYIPTQDILDLSVSVKDYEPVLALDGGADGLDFYRQIVLEAGRFLKSGGILAFEIGYNQGQDVMDIMKENMSSYDVECFQDLAGLDRCVIARKL